MNPETDSQARGPSLIIFITRLLGLVVFLPIVVAWRLSPVLAEHPAWWDSRRWPSVASAAASSVVAVALVLAHQSGAMSLRWDGPTALVVLLIWWAWLVPVAYVFARWRRGLIATAVSESRHDPRQLDRVRRATWTASLEEAKAVSRGLTYPTHLGILLNDDRRDWLTRMRDSRERSRSTYAAWRTPGTRILSLPDSPRSAVVLGGTGSGKTVLLHGLAMAALASGWRVVVLDGKGNADDAQQLLALGERLRLPCATWPAAAFDAWRGDGAAVATKAARCLALDAPTFYRQRAESALFAVAETGPWRSTTQLLERLARPSNWVSDRQTLAALMAKEGRTAIHEVVANEVRSALRGVEGLVDGGPGAWGWDDEETRLVVVSLDVGANAAHRVAAGLMLADLNAYRQSRRHSDARSLLVIVDEGSVLLDDPQAPDLAVLAEQVRSQNIGLVVAAQSVEGLGRQGERLLVAGGDMFAARTGDPEAIARLAGTVKVQEVAHQGTHGGRKVTGVTTAREQAAHRLDPDRLREAPPGCFALIERGQPVRWAAVRPPLTAASCM